jgi:deaminated glutathione amidase
VDANLLEAERLVREAAQCGAGLVVLPENFAFMGRRIQDVIPLAEADGQGRIQAFLANTAAKFGIWIVGGTVPMAARDGGHAGAAGAFSGEAARDGGHAGAAGASSGEAARAGGPAGSPAASPDPATRTPDRVRAACMVYDERGRRVARYDKIHLFDVRVPGADERYEESAAIEPGDATLVIDSPFGRLGVAVCYDLRFPEQFRQMLDDGMELAAIPSAFTAITGKAHWETLVRARAIENLVYVVAGAQGGYHINGRETYGHSMIVDPWGSILAEVPRGTGAICADMDADYLQSVRRNFPVIDHRRLK